MGHITHHAIVVTSWKESLIRKAYGRAQEIFPEVTDIVKSSINHFESFLVPPDGSKEGWSESDIGNSQRDTFIKWLDGQRYEDGSSSLSWVCIQYGDCDGDVKIIADDSGKNKEVKP